MMRGPSLRLTVLGACWTILAHAASDRWGGDDRVRNPASHFQTGWATATDQWTLSDATRNWTTNELAGCILQPDTNRAVYFLVKSNSATHITVCGSDSDANPERAFRRVSDENDGTEPYAVLDRWSARKVKCRWWLFDPAGNAFFIKSLNGYDYETHRNGNDHEGHTFVANLQAKNGVANVHDAHQIEIDVVKQMGFNCWGEVVDTWYTAPGAPYAAAPKDPGRYQPFISFVRINSMTLDATDSFALTALGCSVWDACDPDFKEDIKTNMVTDTGAKTEGMKNFDGRSTWAEWYVTPYRDKRFNIPANPYYIGLDWDEEPPYCRSENANAHLGYYILISPASAPRKQQAVAFLQARYASIAELNNAWGAQFGSWAGLSNATATAIDPLLSAEPYCRDYGTYRETNTALKADLDGVAEDFWRIYTRKVGEALDEMTAAHMLNFGPGYHGWIGAYNAGWDGCASPEYLFRGSVSADGATPFIDVIGVGDPLHGPHERPDDPLEFMRADLVARYAFHGRPYWHESCWLTAEADSGVTRTGAIETLSATVLSDSSFDFRTSNGWNSAFSALGGLWLVPDIRTASAQRVYFRIAADGSAAGLLTIDRARGPGNQWWDDTAPNMTAWGSAGSVYAMIGHDAMFHIGYMATNPVRLYIPATQEERAAMYVNFLKGLAGLQAANGDFIDVGFSQWQFFDYAFREGTQEMRNFGFETVKCQLYDGVEATAANGELQDCGNFTGPASAALQGIYDLLITADRQQAVVIMVQ
jgi:hypothetical protein